MKVEILSEMQIEKLVNRLIKKRLDEYTSGIVDRVRKHEKRMRLTAEYRGPIVKGLTLESPLMALPFGKPAQRTLQHVLDPWSTTCTIGQFCKYIANEELAMYRNMGPLKVHDIRSVMKAHGFKFERENYDPKAPRIWDELKMTEKKGQHENYRREQG